jgi:hypothetical protein
VKAALNVVAFQSQGTKLPEGTQSAIAALSKEKAKL